jgi:hypothetical protein
MIGAMHRDRKPVRHTADGGFQERSADVRSIGKRPKHCSLQTTGETDGRQAKMRGGIVGSGFTAYLHYEASTAIGTEFLQFNGKSSSQAL